MSAPSPSLFRSNFSIPYSPLSPLQSLDIHLLTSLSSSSAPPISIIYIHGGAFRDPLITSRSLVPSLPALFSANRNITAIASLNYRLSPYPSHPTHPSEPTDESRNVVWPAQLHDVLLAIRWLVAEDGGGKWGFRIQGDSGVVLVGHSVGATLAFHAAAVGEVEVGVKVAAVVCLSGIYNFSTLRDAAHPEKMGFYEEFIVGALGAEKEGGWERGDLITMNREGGMNLRPGIQIAQNRVRVAALGHSRADELVEWGQVEGMREALEEEGLVVKMVECEGRHKEIVDGGVEIAKCVVVALDVLVDELPR